MTRCKVEDRNWFDIGSDVCWEDHGGMWARKITDSRYFVIRFGNCDEWGDGATGYCVSLVEIDLTADSVASAMRSYAIPADGKDEYGQPIDPEIYRRMKVWACASTGAFAPLFEQQGNSVWRLVRAAKGEAHRLIHDSAEYEARMDRRVNAIGATARECQNGDMLPAVLRGVEAGDPKAELMLRLGVGR